MTVMVGLVRKVKHSAGVFYKAQSDLLPLCESHHCQDTPEQRRKRGEEEDEAGKQSFHSQKGNVR
jgi:hypothetical protein